MKNIVIFDEYNEIDLKPSKLLQKYIELTEKDVFPFLVEGQVLKEVACPGCHSEEKSPAFTKFGLDYVECLRCHTLYISPRPDDAALNRFYSQSSARLFWHDELLKATRKKRQEKIVKPRFEWIEESTGEHLPKAEHFVDINTDQYGYIEELSHTALFKRKTLINPFVKLEIPVETGIESVNTSWWEAQLSSQADVVSIFEVADRTSDVDALFGKINQLLKKDGLCFLTAILSSGFDLLVLWDKAENLYPPDRLNVFSVEGLKTLAARHGFEILEFSTPGILDVELVVREVQQDGKIKLPRFFRYLLEARDEETKLLFQEFLQAALLSSYGRVLLKKR
jgi:hypothetical protein